MRIVCFSDTHFHDYKTFAKYDNDVNSRFREQLDFIDYLGDIVNKVKPDALFFCGDIVEKKGIVKPSIVIPVLKSFMKNLSDYPLYMIYGNHDMENIYGYYNIVELFALTLPKAIISDFNYTLVDRVLLLPYKKNKDDFLNILKLELGNYDIVISHQGIVQDKKLDKNDILVEELREIIGNTYIFNGHYHIPFVDGRIFNVGASMKHNFNDVQRDSYIWYIDTDTGDYDVYCYDNIDFMDCYFPDDKVKDYTGKYVRCFVDKDNKEDAKIFLEGQAKGFILNVKPSEHKVIEKKHATNIEDIIVNTINKNYPKEKAEKILDLFNNIKGSAS